MLGKAHVFPAIGNVDEVSRIDGITAIHDESCQVNKAIDHSLFRMEKQATCY